MEPYRLDAMKMSSEQRMNLMTTRNYLDFYVPDEMMTDMERRMVSHLAMWDEYDSRLDCVYDEEEDY